MGRRNPCPGNPALARKNPQRQTDRRAHQQHGPVSYRGAAEWSFSPRGQVSVQHRDSAPITRQSKQVQPESQVTFNPEREAQRHHVLKKSRGFDQEVSSVLWIQSNKRLNVFVRVC